MNGEGVLEHRTRRMLYNYILEHPGVTRSVLRRIFDLDESTMRYHLRSLIRTDKAYTKKESGRLRYYSKDLLGEKTRVCSSDPDITSEQRRVLDLIKNYPGITKKELVNLSNLDRKKVKAAIRKLKTLKLVWLVETKNGPGYEYITKEKLYQEMLYVLVKKLASGEIGEETFLRLKDEIKGEK